MNIVLGFALVYAALLLAHGRGALGEIAIANGAAMCAFLISAAAAAVAAPAGLELPFGLAVFFAVLFVSLRLFDPLPVAIVAVTLAAHLLISQIALRGAADVSALSSLTPVSYAATGLMAAVLAARRSPNRPQSPSHRRTSSAQ